MEAELKSSFGTMNMSGLNLTTIMNDSSMDLNMSMQYLSTSGRTRSMTSFYIALGLLYLPGLVTNVLSLRLIFRDIRFVDIPTNMLLFTLCLTDLVAIINSLAWHTIRRYIPVLTRGLCGIKSFLGPFFPLFSGMISALMAVDRSLALNLPYFYAEYIKCSTWRVIIGVLVGTIGLFCLFPMIGLGEFWSRRMYHGRISYVCSSLSFYENPIKRTFIFTYVIIGLIAVFAILVCNISVLTTLLKMRKRVAIAEGISKNDSVKKSLEVEFAKLVGLLTCAFLICWTPFHISILFEAFKLEMSATTIGYIHLLAGMNYTTDPLVYLLARKTYRDTVISFFKQCFAKCKRQNNNAL